MNNDVATGTALAVEEPAKVPSKKTPESKPIRVVEDHGPLAHLMDTARFEHLQRIAIIMASAGVLPDHLARNKKGEFTREQIIGNCFQIVNQSLRWQIDPFAVKDETYVVGGKLGYQGKLVAAVINSRAGLVRNLDYEFTGEGDGRTITVIGQFHGEPKARTITLSVGQAKTDNQMWKKDPDQKLVYSGATKWARRHAPEIMLGVLTDDDLERMQQQALRREATGPVSLEDLIGQPSHVDPAGGGTVLDAAAVSYDASPDLESPRTAAENPPQTAGEFLAAGELPAGDDAPLSDQAADQPAADAPSPHGATDLEMQKLGESISACKSLLELEKIVSAATGNLTSDQENQLDFWASSRRDEIKATRGARGNKQKELGE